MIVPTKTRPAIQWIATQSNWMPSTGKKPVTSRTKIAAVIDQWNRRDAMECRMILSGTPVPTAAGLSGVSASLCLAR